MVCGRTRRLLFIKELDVLAAQLNSLGADSRPPVEDDDSDDDVAPAPDGTLLASAPARPL